MRKAYDLAYWDGAKIADALAYSKTLDAGKVEAIHTTPSDYSDMRKLGRDVMDVNTHAGDLGTGYMGSIYGVPLYVKRDGVLGVLSILGPEDVLLSHVVNPRRWDPGASGDHSLAFHSGSFLGCLDGLCLSMLVMGS